MMRRVIPGIVVALILLVIYSATMLPDLGWEDTSEFALAIDSIGIPHSPGFPLFVLIGRCIQIIMDISGARAATLLSAIGCIGASAIIAVVVRRYSFFLSIAAGLIVGLSPAIWFQATRGEVYGLHLFFATILIALHLSKPSLRTGFLSGYLLALGAVTHPSILVFGLFLSGTKNIRILSATVIGGLLGITCTAFLPIRSANNPFLDWGNPETVSNFLWMVTLREFAGDFSEGALLSHRSVFSAITAVRVFLASAIPPIMWGIILIGIVKGFRFRWRFVSAALSVITFAVLAGKGPDFEAYLLPVIPLSVILGIEGASYLSVSRVFVAFTWILSLIILRGPDLHRLDRSHDISAKRFQNELSAEINGSILFTDNTSDFFLMYHHSHAEQKTPWIVYTPYLKFKWYRDSLPAPLNTLLPGNADPEFSIIETSVNQCGKTARYTFSDLPHGALGVLIPDLWTFHSLYKDTHSVPWSGNIRESYSCQRTTPGAHHLAIRLGQGGQLLSSHNRPEEASQRFSSALQLEPDNPALWLSLSRSYLHQHKRQEALRSLKAMTKVPDLRIDHLHLAARTAMEIMQRNPSTDVDSFFISLFEDHTSDATLGAEAIRSALLMQSPRIALERVERYQGEMTSEILNLVGTANLLTGDFVTAESRFHEALNMSKDEEIQKRIAANLITCMRYQKQYSKADSVARAFGFRIQE
jgi:hypothetical protein